MLLYFIANIWKKKGRLETQAVLFYEYRSIILPSSFMTSSGKGLG